MLYFSFQLLEKKNNFILFVFISLFYFFFYFQPVTVQAENTVLLVTVSDDRSGRKGGQYAETQIKIERIFRNNPEFGITQFHMWSWSEIIQTDFYEKNRILLDNNRADRNGRAYKPFVIYNGLKNLDNGDFLIYTDCSPEMWANMSEGFKIDLSLYDLQILKDLCLKNNGILTPYIFWENDKTSPYYELALKNKHSQSEKYGYHTHANFTLDRCMEKMGLFEYRSSLQHGSGTIIICKSENTLRFVEEWLYWNLIDECASLGWANIEDDLSFWKEELSIKLGHRHDQSISGLLINKMGLSLINEGPRDSRFPYIGNFLRFCRVGMSYEFIDSNITK